MEKKKYVVLVYSDHELLCERYFDNEEDANEFQLGVYTDNGIIIEEDNSGEN